MKRKLDDGHLTDTSHILEKRETLLVNGGNMESNKESRTVQPLELDDEDRECIAKLSTILAEAFQSVAKLTRLPVPEVLHILEEVDVAKLKDATQNCIKRISHATDLDSTHIVQVFTSDPSASIDEIVIRLHERSRVNRAKW
jgi:hypothetical protein